ncbi:MAG: LamG-like jellyroll fold domain-containing protein [Vicingaceae bacterium]
MIKSLITLLLSLPFLLNAQSLSDSLKAHFKFENNTLDSSPLQGDLVLDNSLAWTRFSVLDRAVYFDGAAKTESVGSFDNSQFTKTAIAMWFKTSNITNSKQNLIQGANMRFGVFLERVSNKTAVAAFFNTPSSIALVDTTNIADGYWHHLVAQNNGDTTFLYLDGVFKGKKYQLMGVGNNASNNKLHLGQTNLGNNNYTGSLNDLRIYNRMLSQAEIDSLSTFPQPPQFRVSDSLKAHFIFDGDVLDYSGNNEDLNNPSFPDYRIVSGSDSAYYFDGSSQLYSQNRFDNSTYIETSISLWMRSSTMSISNQILIQGANLGFGIFINSSSEVSAFFDPPSSSSVSDTTNVLDNKWHHIVAQNDGDTTFIYIDGDFKSKKYQPLGVGAGTSTNEKLYLGSSNLNTRYYTGAINDLRIYNRILSQAEIDTLSTFSCNMVATISSSTDVTCLGGNDGSITVSIDSGTTNYNYNWSNSSTALNVSDTFNTITGLATGKYYVTITDTNCCSVIDSATISLLDSTVASNDTVNIAACDNYTWAQNNQAYSNSGIYNDTSFSALGCDSVYHVLDLSILNLDLTVVNTRDSLYAQQAGNTYQWIDCGNGDTLITGATGKGFKPGVTGDFAVIIDNGICFDTSTCNSVTPVGLVKLSSSSELKLFPNPAAKNITIESENSVGKIAQIKSITGALILEFNITRKKEIVDLSHLENGIYFLKLGPQIKKLIVSK